ncbi:MAG: glycosyltransferase involved in cell wall biosynthesis [Planctomycetota bacterium]|jgi:glycosyltransferase involved in cell wall biosynthesis
MTRRILFVTQQLPWPKDSGGNIRTYFMLEALAREFEVVLCSTTDGSAKAKEGERVLGELCHSLRLVPDDKQHSSLGMAIGVLRSLLSGVPAVLLHNENPALKSAVVEELQRGNFDSVHINHLDTSLYFDFANSPPCVIDTHNLLFEYYTRRADVEKSVLRRWVCRREGRLLATQEPEILRGASRVLVCSEAEQASLEALGGNLTAVVVPNGVDCAQFKPKDTAPSGAGCDLVFVGDLAYGPNQDAALRFIKEILPLVQCTEPRARFLAVGKNPPTELIEIGARRDDVTVTGFVDDVSDWVHPAAVYVVPIRYGSGTRLKVLEAFALGKATVSTSIGAEGIATREGVDILLRDDPEEMSQAILSLLADRDLAARMGLAARQAVEGNYDWKSIGEVLVGVHRDIAAPST